MRQLPSLSTLLVLLVALQVVNAQDLKAPTVVMSGPCTAQSLGNDWFVIGSTYPILFESGELSSSPFSGSTLDPKPVFGCDPTQLWLQVHREDNGRDVIYSTVFHSGFWTERFESAGSDPAKDPAPLFSVDPPTPNSRQKLGVVVTLIKFTQILTQGPRVVFVGDFNGIDGASSRAYELTATGQDLLFDFGAGGIETGSLYQACITGNDFYFSERSGPLIELFRVDRGGNILTINHFSPGVMLACTSSGAKVTLADGSQQVYPD